MSNMQVEAHGVRHLIRLLEESGITDQESIEISITSESALPEAVDAAVQQLGEVEAMIAALDKRADELGARKARLRERGERIRGAVVSALELAGVPSVPTPEGSVYLVRGRPSVRVFDEESIPAEFRRTVTKVSPDLTAIKRALEAGQSVPGVGLSNGATSLGVRRS